jgi:hypothetical protein
MRVACRIFSCISWRRGFVMLRFTWKKIYIMPHSAQMENLFSKIRLLLACMLSWALWMKEAALQIWKQGLANFNNHEFHMCRFARSYYQICLSGTYYHFQRCNNKSEWHQLSLSKMQQQKWAAPIITFKDATTKVSGTYYHFQRCNNKSEWHQLSLSKMQQQKWAAPIITFKDATTKVMIMMTTKWDFDDDKKPK